MNIPGKGTDPVWDKNQNPCPGPANVCARQSSHSSRNLLSLLYCPSRKLISHTLMPPIVRNDDVGHRLLGIVLPSQGLVTEPVASQDYPFPAIDVCASDGNS
jgi:hypothetical protein